MGTNEKSAIIGYWRSDASLGDISTVTGLPFWVIEKVINDYKDGIIRNKLSELPVKMYIINQRDTTGN